MTSSPLKFLVDVGVGTLVEKYLLKSGFDALSVREIDPTLLDEDIIRFAREGDRIIITMDKDFGELVYHSLIQHSGIVLLRLDDATGAEKVAVIARILKDYSPQLRDSFTVYQNDKCRIKQMRGADKK